MNLIKQHRTNDCAIACFAMFIGVSYWRAAWMILGLTLPFYWIFDRTTKIRKLVNAALKLGVRLTLFELNEGYSLNDIHRNAILLLWTSDYSRSHAIVWDGVNKQVLDPMKQNPLTTIEQVGQRKFLMLMVDR